MTKNILIPNRGEDPKSETLSEVYIANTDTDGQKGYSFTNSESKAKIEEQAFEETEMFRTSVTVGTHVSTIASTLVVFSDESSVCILS